MPKLVQLLLKEDAAKFTVASFGEHFKTLYDPSKDFTCFDGSITIPFRFVNDDYCDCGDGSDEPGTSACTDCLFHCSNVGHVPMDIPSSRVNDGICDCCDTSDEYNSTAQCVNNCLILGEAAREEQRRQQEVFERGAAIRDEFIKEAKNEIAECEMKLQTLRKEIAVLEAIKNEKLALKKTAEEKERIAIEKHKLKVDESNKARTEEEIAEAAKEDQKLAEAAFIDLDTDGDEKIHFTELKPHLRFDQNKDGEVSDDEAKFFLHMKEEMDLDEFISVGWVIMKPYYFAGRDTSSMRPPKLRTPKPADIPDLSDSDLPSELTEPSTNTEESGSDDRDVDYEEDSKVPPFSPKPTEETPSVPYDEETQKLVDIAKRAREEYSDAESKYQDLLTKIRELEVTLETDYGPEKEFMALRNRCFELSERQYVYKLCPFDKASQKSIGDSSSEVSLGRWGKWTGPEDNKYQSMKFEGGAGCWNGPERSVEIFLNCADRNALLTASEPARCEYKFEFQTPAMCVRAVEKEPEHEHTEL
ncbi:glucosidase 2 subunit beta-like protein 1 [Dinothrombium tinctorium]|uniref:Glucosidase 2 subunit beta n=3 Tax=Dinothrombium tinctorium TaxID=1965070 RepID=A0A443RJE9_9ACAR|nr:glucosidase 2 subunit beta-like protein 1 [Dinothrombium tinctorium]